MAKQKNIWKFNDEEWKAHIDNKDLFEKVKKKFDLGKSITIYYESGSYPEKHNWYILLQIKNRSLYHSNDVS